ncbi:hypothetical protein Droror1_Dr00026500 [Drosera rotundifolia]
MSKNNGDFHVVLDAGDLNDAIDVIDGDDVVNKVELDLTAVELEPVPPPVVEREREMVMVMNMRTSWLDVTEPEANDEVTGDKEAHMASVFSRYWQTLLERTKYHLGSGEWHLTRAKLALPEVVANDLLQLR